MNFIKMPNLPQNKVETVLISKDAKSAIKTLRDINIKTVLTTSCNLFDEPVKNHADMMFIHTGNQKCIVQGENKEFVNKLTKLGLDVTLAKNIYSKKYPNDVGLNCAIIGKYLIGREESVDKALLELCNEEKIQIINVKQGYSKCSICIVNEGSIITEDESIYNALKNKFDVLKIESGSILLKGYNYGFFGGCCGLIDKNLLAINGDIKLHKNYIQIITFLRERKIDILSVKSGFLEDIGSIIPIIEE